MKHEDMYDPQLPDVIYLSWYRNDGGDSEDFYTWEWFPERETPTDIRYVRDDGWHPASEPPEHGEKVFVVCDDGVTRFVWQAAYGCDTASWYTDYPGWEKRITHWRELPPLPERKIGGLRMKALNIKPNNWNPACDPPGDGKAVLVLFANQGSPYDADSMYWMDVAHYFMGAWIHNSGEYHPSEISHWRELPEMPEGHHS